MNKFRLWFQNARILDLNRQIFVEASSLRAGLRALRTPDAIHLAAAQHYGLDEFWTNDDRLSKVRGSVTVKNILNA